MLGWFPTPVPDESLYSLMARYWSMVGPSSSMSFMRHVYGVGTAEAVLDFPPHLGALCERLPREFGLTPERVVVDHTDFRYALRFSTPEMRRRVIELMFEPGGRRPARQGVMSTTFVPSSFLFLCPVCLRHDLETLAVGCWRRTHQLPGVRVCPEHFVPLNRTRISRSAQDKRRYYLPPVEPPAFDRLPAGMRHTQIQTQIAAESRQLLECAQEFEPLASLQARLRSSAVGAGWHPRGSRLILTSELSRALCRHITSSVRPSRPFGRSTWMLRSGHSAPGRRRPGLLVEC